MEAAMLSSLYLVPEWMERLLEDYQDEVSGVNAWNMKLLTNEVRKAVWNTSMILGVHAHGIPGQACRLLEIYLLNYVYKNVDASTDAEVWEDFSRMLSARVPLLIASCVQLAAKMNSVEMVVHPTAVRNSLLWRGVIWTVEDIIRSEFQVFHTIGFRVPLWTSVEAGQLLATDVGMPLSMMEGVALVVDMAEYRRDGIDRRLREIAAVSPDAHNHNHQAATLRTLHLAAGAVLAASRILGFQGLDPSPRLSLLTRAPLQYVRCICDVILHDLMV